MKFVHELTAEEFCFLQKSVGFGEPSIEMIKKALKNTPYLIAAKVNGKTVGMGRVVGDMAKIAYIQDLFILPEYQGKGIGQTILLDLLEYIKAEAVPGSTIRIGLMAAVGKEEFYCKHGFHKRPNDNEGCGMMMIVNVPEAAVAV